MSGPDPISPGTSVPPPPPVVNPPVPASPPPATPTQFNIRAGYRMTYGGSVTAHGIQLLGGPTFRLSPNFRLTLQIENNWLFIASDKPASSLSRDAVLGGGFAGIRHSSFDGTTYTDVTGGTAVANQALFMELIPELQFAMRPVADFPFDITLRFGGGLVYAQTHTRTTVATTPPGSHSGPGGCIPGDIHCGDAPIPEPTAGSGYGPFETDAGAWTYWVRFGPRLSFPINDYFQAGTEVLFRTNSTSGGIDEFWRTDIRLGLPIGDHFMLVASPRYIMSNTDKGLAHGFDLFAGAQGRW